MATSCIPAILAALIATFAPLALGAAPLNFTPAVLFSDGDVDEHNRTWACTRGSSLLRSPNGSLLAFFGGMASCADGVTDSAMLMRSSPDNGTSWSAVHTIHNYSTVSGYSSPMVDHVNGDVLIFFNVLYAETWLLRSKDNGATFGQPLNLTATVGPNIQLGTDSSVQLASGRFVLSPHDSTGNYALLSDDFGTSWHRGTSVSFNGSGMTSGGESQITDNPGKGPKALVMTIRVEGIDVDRHHALAESDDGGESWSMPVLVPASTGPTCEGSVGRFANGTLLLSAPDNFHWRYPADRRNMHVWALAPNASAKGGYSSMGTVEIFHGPAAYSGLTQDGDFIIFEGGPAFRYQSVMVARVPPFG